MSGIRKIGDTIVLDFTTHDPNTGSIQDADTPPTCEVFEDSNDSPILSPTVTKRTGKTGDYRVSIEATIANGFEVGKSYNVIVAASVAGVSAKSRIASFTLDSKRIIDLNDITVEDIEGSSIIAKEATSNTIRTDVELILKIETNRWKIIDNQMIIYDDDGITPLYVFNLKNKQGQPAEEDVYERVPV